MPIAREFFFAGCVALAVSQLHAEPASYAAEAEVFAREMVERHGFDLAKLRSGVPTGIALVEKTPAPPDTTAGDLRAAGVAWDEPLPTEVPASLIRLDGVDDEYWVGLDNFYAITRYNHSNLYAMAVHQLSEAIRAGYAAESRGTGGDPSAADARESAENQ